MTANPLAPDCVRCRPPVAPLPTADTGAQRADRTAATASPATDEVGHFQLPQVGHFRLPLTRGFGLQWPKCSARRKRRGRIGAAHGLNSRPNRACPRLRAWALG